MEAQNVELVPVRDYLAGELVSPAKHEYVGGAVYAMAGATNRHNTVALSATGGLLSRLRKRRCRPFNSDTKVRIKLPGHVRYYYPDAMVVCTPNPDGDTWQDHPVVILEVVSPSTRRVDEGEKKDAYLTISSLDTYILLEQDEPKAVVWQRGERGFQPALYAGLGAEIPLPALGFRLPLAELYEQVDFTAPSAPAEE